MHREKMQGLQGRRTMNFSKIGVLHPGEMGISLAASVQNSGHLVYWASEERSAATRVRAEQFHLHDAGSLDHLCTECELLISVCPPHAAEAVAQQVLATPFRGVYLDVNAIAPQRVIRMGQAMSQAGMMFIDGGIIGGPAWELNKTVLYLSGPHADEISPCFSEGLPDIRILGDSIGTASAMKMCYSAYSKGSTALLSAVLAAAEQLEVEDILVDQWDRDHRGFSEQVIQRIRTSARKAWRFEGEMEEIAATFAAVGLPDGFHSAAAQIYHRLEDLKDAPTVPLLEDVIDALNGKKQI
jgi:3-hydroxyisobutyrate dehydrogenase-like beta-hydroxyacid dehydrogenase